MAKPYKEYTSTELSEWIPELIAHDDIHAFYNTTAWKHLRRQVLEEQHHECQLCRAEGKMVPADTVHHVKEVKEHPELALDKNNLMCLCRECHEKIHGRDGFALLHKKKRWTDEKW